MTHPDAPPPFACRIRVYWEDTDAGGVVFYANYLRYFERARTEWLRAAGIGQQALREAQGLMFVVTQSLVDYHRSAVLDDELTVTVAAVARRRASLTLEQQVLRGDQVCAQGRIALACVQVGSLKIARIPAFVWQQLGLPPPE